MDNTLELGRIGENQDAINQFFNDMAAQGIPVVVAIQTEETECGEPLGTFTTLVACEDGKTPVQTLVEYATPDSGACITGVYNVGTPGDRPGRLSP
jgi:hypothetical protein